MRTCTRTDHTATTLLLMLGLVSLAAAWPAAAQEVCPGFDSKHTITRLGGANALSPGGLQTKAELQAYFASHGEELRAILADQGLGGEVADALLAAVRDDVGIAERPIFAGEELEWMAYRKEGKVQTIADVCLNLSAAKPAFEVAVPVVTHVKEATPDCTIEVSTDCQPGGTSSFKLRTAPGARVTLAGPAGDRTIVEGGGSSWTGAIDDPYEGDYEFTAVSEAESTETVTTYTFLVPRECVNLALVGLAEEQHPGAPVSCSESRSMSRPVCPVPPPPSCVIEIEQAEVRRDEIVAYGVSGEWAELDLELMHDGAALAQPVLGTASGTFIPEQRGTYTVVGTATNVLGQTHECRASIEVVGADWIVRPFAAFLWVDGEADGGAVSAAKSCPCPPGANFGYDNGWGLGASVERLFTDRFGLEARAIFARLDSDFWIGANGLEITDSDTADHWELSLGLNVHLLLDRPFDWYAGPFVGYGDLDGYRSMAYGRSLVYDPDGELTWGAQTGFDWPFGTGPWSLHAGARYTLFSADVNRRFTDSDGAMGEQRMSIDIDPITIELGVAYHF